MKKQVLLLIMMVLPMVANAYDAEIDGIYYNFNYEGKRASVTFLRYKSPSNENAYSGDVIIPSEVTYNGEKYSVTSIDDYAFQNCSKLNSITISNNVTSIGNCAFEDCNLRYIYIKNANPPDVGISPSTNPTIYNVFSVATCNHATLYVPYGTWSDYAYNYKWGCFLHIKEMTTSTEDLALQRAYILMNMDDSNYAVYDPIDNGVKSLASMNSIDEDDPNHIWQITEKDGKTYLYNIGAKKFAKSSANGVGFTLSDTPCPITMENGEDGIVLGSQRKTQWSFVVNEGQSANQNLNNVITGIQSTVKKSQENAVDWYSLDGRNMEKEPIEKGVYIVNGKKVYVK